MHVNKLNNRLKVIRVCSWRASEGAQGRSEDGGTRREWFGKTRPGNTLGGRWKMMRSRLRNMRNVIEAEILEMKRKSERK